MMQPLVMVVLVWLFMDWIEHLCAPPPCRRDWHNPLPPTAEREQQYWDELQKKVWNERRQRSRRS